MKIRDYMLYMSAMRGRRPGLTSRIATMCFLLLCAVFVIYGGVKSGYMEWVQIGLIWAVIDIIVIAILIFINIRRNRPRW